MSNLRSTVESHPDIFEVYFDGLGNHYFNAREFQGVKFGQYINGMPIIETRITETKTREQVLGVSRNFDTTDKIQYVEKVKNKNKNAKAND